MNGVPSVSDIWTARSRIGQLVGRTPTLMSRALTERLGSAVFLKWEIMHPTGAFKIRGAANKLLSLTAEESSRGVAAFSTGNHGMSVAYVASRLGMPATVCVSERVPRNKIEALRRFGATVEVSGKGQDEAEAHCYDLERERGFVVVKPFDDPLVIAGQGTIGLELMEDLPGVMTVLVPLSGGGIIAGIALAVKANSPGSRIVGITMERGAAMYESLRAGAPVAVEEVETLADSLLGGIGENNRYTFDLVKRLVDETVVVPEDAIAEAMAFLFREHRVAVEGAAAVGVAALLRGIVRPAGGPTAVVLTGSNVDVQGFLAATRPYLTSPTPS